MEYKVYAALIEDLNQGWVWIHDPNLTASSELRPIIRITTPKLLKAVYCEALYIDPNYVDYYNEKKSTYKITFGDRIIVINEWYRKKLGNIRTYAKTNKEEELGIEICDNVFWQIMACLQHPQVVVRIATWLGIIGVVLGVIGIVGLIK